MRPSREFRRESRAVGEELADGIARAIELSPRDALEHFKRYLSKISADFDKLLLIQDCTFRMWLNYTWYECLLRLYEMTDKIRKYPFIVSADVAPTSTYEYTIDLTDTGICCIGPMFQCSTDLEGYNILTCTINEPPVDKRLNRWLNKQRIIMMPTRVEFYPIVHIPKGKLKVQFTNNHPTETAHDSFILTCMLVEIDFALKYMTNIYDIMQKFFEELWYGGWMR